MSHLPECYKEGSTDSCICDELRACEQRVIAEREADGPWFRSVVHDCCVDKQTAYAAGLDAAREAVVALPMMKIAGNFPLYDADEAIAAIDALRTNTSP